MKNFNDVLHLDQERKTLDVEGLATYETIVNHTLDYGLLPTVSPELKHITIGGVIAGIGIESTCYRYGFVHEGLLEAEVLLSDGRIVICTPANEFSDLFYALPNSYGTLGYVLRAKIRLIEAGPYVHVQVSRFNSIEKYLEAMLQETQNPQTMFIEGLFYSKDELYLVWGRPTDDVPYLDDIYHKSIYYKLCSERKDIYLKTADYIFRYDPDWFWHIPEIPFYSFLRWISPKSIRNSGFYKKYSDAKHKLSAMLKLNTIFDTKDQETLIQDWEVPWDKAKDLIEFALAEVDLSGKPWTALPIRPSRNATLYPMQDCPFYFNLGCYYFAKKQHQSSDEFFYTRLMDNRCFRLGGIKMLYSSTFLAKDQFDAIYNGNAYRRLKQKYDPDNRLPDLYEKAVRNQ